MCIVHVFLVFVPSMGASNGGADFLDDDVQLSPPFPPESPLLSVPPLARPHFGCELLARQIIARKWGTASVNRFARQGGLVAGARTFVKAPTKPAYRMTVLRAAS
jgi:hypothetical protein